MSEKLDKTGDLKRLTEAINEAERKNIVTGVRARMAHREYKIDIINLFAAAKNFSKATEKLNSLQNEMEKAKWYHFGKKEELQEKIDALKEELVRYDVMAKTEAEKLNALNRSYAGLSFRIKNRDIFTGDSVDIFKQASETARTMYDQILSERNTAARISGTPEETQLMLEATRGAMVNYNRASDSGALDSTIIKEYDKNKSRKLPEASDKNKAEASKPGKTRTIEELSAMWKNMTQDEQDNAMKEGLVTPSEIMKLMTMGMMNRSGSVSKQEGKSDKTETER